MKRFIWAATLTLVCGGACGQGWVDFANYSDGVDAPDFRGDGITGLTGPQYNAGLLAGPAATNLTLIATVPFLTGAGAGYFLGGPVTIPNVAGRATAWVQVVAWDTTLGGRTNGATFFQAQAFGPMVWGTSAVFSVVTGDPVGVPPDPPRPLVGLTSFTVPGCSFSYFEEFTIQPTNQTVLRGSSVEFVVRASACPGPFYQWFCNGTALAGATDSSYRIASAQRTNAGTYSAVLSNAAWGVHTSATAALNVLVEPIITSSPQSQTVFVGATVNFHVAAAGLPPLGYQWFFNRAHAIDNATLPELSLANVQAADAGAYTVVVTNAFGAVTSPPATLAITGSPPIVLQPPRSQTVAVGRFLDLTVTATGSLPLSYQWSFGNTVLAGASNTSLALTDVRVSQSGPYRVVVTNAFGAVTSTAAMLNVVSNLPSRPSGNVAAWGYNVVAYAPPGTRFIAVAAGGSHSLALESDGTLIGWGANSYRVSTLPAGLTHAAAIAAGAWHNLALRSDGTVVAWGDNVYGQTNVPAGLSGIIAVSAGGEHSLALRDDGTVVSWGLYGQSSVPAGLTGVVSVSAGGHSLALKSDGTVVAWGKDNWGQTNVPAGLNEVIGVSAGGEHSLALKSDGTVVAWGRDSSGETTVPAGLSGVIGIAAGNGYSLALKSNGTVVAWGDNSYGETEVPPDLNGVIAIAAGVVHNLALKSDGSIIAWGYNGNGEVVVPGSLRHITSIAEGAFHTLALKSDGTVLAWGSDYFGESSVPPGLRNVIAVAASDHNSFALKSDGTVVSWGYNGGGQVTVPPGLTGVVGMGAGGGHNLAVKYDGTVVAWGDNSYGQTNVPLGLERVVCVAAGSAHSLALKSDGTVAAWGYNGDGESTVPVGLGSVIGIAAGQRHSLAVKADGTVVAWGDNEYGQTNVPVGLSGVIAVAGGWAHSIAVRADGTVVGWGAGGPNQVGAMNFLQSAVPPGLERVLALAADGWQSLALVSESPSSSIVPQNQTAEVGATASFQAHAQGLQPLAYQWYFNGTTHLTGATNSVLVLEAVLLNQTGPYTVVITNIAGVLTSAPAMLSVIPVVDRGIVPALTVTGPAGSTFHLDYTEDLGPSASWLPLAKMTISEGPLTYIDPTFPIRARRFYHAWQPPSPGSSGLLNLTQVPAIRLHGDVGSIMRLDYIEQYGPTQAWFTLATIALTNTSELYFDTSAIGQPARLWRIVPVP